MFSLQPTGKKNLCRRNKGRICNNWGMLNNLGIKVFFSVSGCGLFFFKRERLIGVKLESADMKEPQSKLGKVRLEK
jgi:hypothetical protein